MDKVLSMEEVVFRKKRIEKHRELRKAHSIKRLFSYYFVGEDFFIG